MEQLKDEFLNYFITKIYHDTDINDSYFCMPSNDCFTYCINELRSALSNQLEENIRNNYVLELSRWFYCFLEKDKILKSFDSLRFSHLLLLLKEMSEGKQVSKEETISLLSNFKHLLSQKYLTKVSEEILNLSISKNPDYDYLDYLIELFLNECLARDIDIRFMNRTITWFRSGFFSSLQNFLEFYTSKVHISYDIYIPIKNYSTINKDVFEKNDQEVVLNDDVYYLHIYENGTIDYYNIITSHMVRVDSIFNMLKLYTSSEIDYDRDKDILVDISCSSIKGPNEEFIKFSEITKYKGVSPYSKFMVNTIENLNKLYDYDKKLYHKILNIIGYSEKDNDIIAPSSYVDAWIALESLYSLNALVTGYPSVKKYLPSFISSKVLINKLTFILKKSVSNSRNRIKAENFVKMNDQQFESLLLKVKSLYCKRELIKFRNRLSSIKALSAYYSSIEKRISIDIIRIYMLRNEYVHESKLSAFKSLQFYRLKNYLTLSIDLFFSMLNQKIELIKKPGLDIGYEIFSKIKEKNNLRNTLFIVSNEKRKYNNNSECLSIKEIDNNVVLVSDVIINIILNNNYIVQKFIKYEDE